MTRTARSIGLLLVLAVVLIAAGYVSLNPPGKGGSGDGEGLGYRARPVQLAPERADLAGVPSMEKVFDRLAEARPFNIFIVGDSTGISERGWQRQLMAWLGEKTGRAVSFTQWFTTEDGGQGYYKPFELVGGGGAPINVYNASAGGKGWDYTEETLSETMDPLDGKRVDLLIVNHGHNVFPAGDYYAEGVLRVMDPLVREHPEMGVLLMKQNPEKNSNRDSAMRSVSRQIDFYSEETGAMFVDVFAAFEETGQPESLIDKTKFHPTPKGYVLWFETVRDALEPLLPTRRTTAR
ncbi:SGNH/GDSL hydrolase family protein [Nocardioides nanhaiensis]